MLEHRDIPVDDDLALGTIDAWLIWNLTGGEVFATDVTNASRTMLCDIRTRTWDPELCELIGVPMSALPEIVPSSGRIGVTSSTCGVPEAIPVSGVAGDQQAALFGQACVTPGMAKNTYGTGSFVLLNVGEACPPPTEGMLTTVAWTLADGTTHYALEGAIFVTGAAIQWLRDGINIIDDAAETGPLAASVPDTGGVYVVPAFAGLGSPYWDPYARGTIVGITRGTGAPRSRAPSSSRWRTRSATSIDAMVAASGTPIVDLRVDGGRVRDGPALSAPGRSARCDRAAPRRPGDDRARRRVPRRARRGRLGVDRRHRHGVDARGRVHPARRIAPPPTPSTAQWLRAVDRSRAWES